jgi:hypothetical protein
LNKPRAALFARDWDIHHLASTNKEVDNINEQYIQDYASAVNEKIVQVSAKSGSGLLFAKGCQLTLLQNIRTDYGICNGMICKGVGVLYESYDIATCSQVRSAPLCLLVRPLDSSIKTGWNDEILRILSKPTVRINRDASWESLSAEEISTICSSLEFVLPVSYVSKCNDDLW